MSGLLSEEREFQEITMLPPTALKKMKCWIRSRHLICAGNFFILETLEYSTVERFEDCICSLGGSLISVDAIKKSLDWQSPTSYFVSSQS